MFNSSYDMMNWLNIFSENCRYKNLIEIIGQKAASLTYGRTNPVVNSEKEDIPTTLNKWMEKVNFIETLKKSEYIDSTMGKTILYLNPTESGDLTLKYLKNPFEGRVSKIDEREQIAVIIDRSYQGDYAIVRRTTFTPKTIQVENYWYNNETRIADKTAEIPKDLIPVKEYKISFENELGFVPFVEIENLVVVNRFGGTTFNIRPDWLPAKGLLDLINETFRISEVELRTNRTKVAGAVSAKELLRDNPTSNALQDFMKDSYLFNKGTASAYNNGQSNSSMFEILAGDPKLETYDKHISFLEDQIFNAAGYTPPRAGAGDTYKNLNESLNSDKLDIETTTAKRAIRIPKIYKLLDFVLQFYGVNSHDENGERLYSIDFNDLSMSSQLQKIDRYEKLLAMNVVDRVEARADIMGMSKKMAEATLPEEIDPFAMGQEEMNPSNYNKKTLENKED